MASEASPIASRAPVFAPSAQGELRCAITAKPWRKLEAQVAEWDRLAADAAEPNPFFESWYLLPSLAAFDPAGVEILQFRSGGQLLGLMPISRSWRYYHRALPNMSAWSHHNMFLGAPLVAAGHEEAFWNALLDWCDGHAGASLFLHIPQMPLCGASYRALRAVAARQNRQVSLVRTEDRAMLASQLSSDAYYEASLPNKKRKELRRQFNRLSELGEVDFARWRDSEGLDAWIDAFLALERSGWKGQAGSALGCAPETDALFRKSLAGAARRGRLERLSLTLDARPVAMLATFLCPPGAFSFKTAFNEDYARFSPGVLLQRENLEILADETIEWSDSCASADHPMIDHLWRERRTIGSLSIAIGGTVRRTAFAGVAYLENARGRAGGNE